MNRIHTVGNSPRIIARVLATTYSRRPSSLNSTQLTPAHPSSLNSVCVVNLRLRVVSGSQDRARQRQQTCEKAIATEPVKRDDRLRHFGFAVGLRERHVQECVEQRDAHAGYMHSVASLLPHNPRLSVIAGKIKRTLHVAWRIHVLRVCAEPLGAECLGAHEPSWWGRPRCPHDAAILDQALHDTPFGSLSMLLCD